MSQRSDDAPFFLRIALDPILLLAFQFGHHSRCLIDPHDCPDSAIPPCYPEENRVAGPDFLAMAGDRPTQGGVRVRKTIFDSVYLGVALEYPKCH
jgi:hypothetical protein